MQIKERIMELQIKHVSKKYGRNAPYRLQDINLTLQPGIVGLLGPNGAGKSTLMNVIATLLEPSEGKVLWNGVDMSKNPDALRGQGFTPEQRGDVAYIGQLEDDLADLIGVAQQKFPETTMIIGGHSSGGGLAVRFAGGEHGTMADAYLLLAPFLKYNAPTTRRGSGGWARPLTRRIMGLTMLNSIGIRWFNGLTVIQINMPQAVLDGPLGDSATTAYSYRLNTAYAPRSKYGRDLAAITQPLLVVAGTDDESFIAEQYEPTISAHTSIGTYSLLPDVGHIDLLTTPEIEPVLAEWLVDLD
jgi:energy-coupling factor transporter ATP-binding protein EcfA2